MVLSRTLLAFLLLSFCCHFNPGLLSVPDVDPPVIAYSADCPNIQCLADRVLAETDPHLSPRQRARLWRDYGLRCTFEWVVPASGFTYHELSVVPWPLWRRWIARATHSTLQ